MRAFTEFSDPALLTERAIDQLKELKGDPFFLTVFFSAAHFPYSAPDPFYKRFSSPKYEGAFRYQKPPLSAPPTSNRDIVQIRSLYDGAVAATDQAVARLLTSLDEQGLKQNTIVVLLADHGENLYDEPGRGMGHGDHLLGGAADHVPWIFVDPVDRFQPHDVTGLVRDVDLAPTLSKLLHVQMPNADGVDLSPLLRGEKNSLDLDAFAETEFWFTESGPGFEPDQRLPYPAVTGATDLADDGDIFLRPELQDTIVTAKHRAIRTEDYKLTYRPTRHGVDYQLFDRKRDPKELHDLASEKPAVVTELRRKLEAWMTADGHTVIHNGFAVPK